MVPTNKAPIPARAPATLLYANRIIKPGPQALSTLQKRHHSRYLAATKLSNPKPELRCKDRPSILCDEASYPATGSRRSLSSGRPKAGPVGRHLRRPVGG